MFSFFYTPRGVRGIKHLPDTLRRPQACLTQLWNSSGNPWKTAPTSSETLSRALASSETFRCSSFSLNAKRRRAIPKHYASSETADIMKGQGVRVIVIVSKAPASSETYMASVLMYLIHDSIEFPKL